MKVFYLNHPHQFNKNDFPPHVLALGFFDGVHLGHRQVIQTAKEKAGGMSLPVSIMTFDPHPSAVLGKSTKVVKYITPLKEKIEIINRLGIDNLFVVHFTESFAKLLPQEFVDQYIIGLHVKHVVAGFDYSYGRLGKGTMETMPFHSREEFTSTTVEKHTLNDEKVSSTQIREMLADGRTEELPSLLGRFYTTSGTVIHGEKRGRQLGFPTANISLSEEFIYPSPGVYAVRIQINDEWYHGVCNVGFKPTFHEKRPENPNVEVHIFDFDRSIYGENVKVEWHKRLRSEQKFNGLEALVEQISKDKQEAKSYFGE
ncbi:bifunctional riboflavin kinase/FAD synthetase [Peribacillus deserti]|uniref:Riboflavin biosynthesis protein n=1 Tax=Peribacillus deserti TaxID=673318 RepID=A0A2N5MB51_9BACI|nr:bifunctional riboflavin kinase/FAD synthetase [Peribacillus deserti]PLT31590.1 bifunctional riboflavin kinase/FAD synthetase [Peribacillus deserti]